MSSTGGAPQADFAPSHAFTGVELSDSGGGGAVRHVVFDEAVIAEHDKDRGTRRKISEPKTPYRAPMSAGSVGSAASDDSMSGPVSADRLAAALGSGWDESDGDEGIGEWESPEGGGGARVRKRRSSGDGYASESGSSVGSRASKSSLRSGSASREVRARFADGSMPGDDADGGYAGDYFSGGGGGGHSSGGSSGASPSLPGLPMGIPVFAEGGSRALAFAARRRAHYAREARVSTAPTSDSSDDGRGSDGDEDDADDNDVESQVTQNALAKRIQEAAARKAAAATENTRALN